MSLRKAIHTLLLDTVAPGIEFFQATARKKGLVFHLSNSSGAWICRLTLKDSNALIFRQESVNIRNVLEDCLTFLEGEE